MNKVDKTVMRETGYITAWVVILSVFMQAVFLVFKAWDYTVLLGTLLGASVAVLNFFLMGITVQKAVLKEEKAAKDLIKLSQTLRNFMLIITAVIGAAVPFFNLWAVIVPLFFPRVAITLRPLFDRK